MSVSPRRLTNHSHSRASVDAGTGAVVVRGVAVYVAAANSPTLLPLLPNAVALVRRGTPRDGCDADVVYLPATGLTHALLVARVVVLASTSRAGATPSARNATAAATTTTPPSPVTLHLASQRSGSSAGAGGDMTTVTLAAGSSADVSTAARSAAADGAATPGPAAGDVGTPPSPPSVVSANTSISPGGALAQELATAVLSARSGPAAGDRNAGGAAAAIVGVLLTRSTTFAGVLRHVAALRGLHAPCVVAPRDANAAVVAELRGVGALYTASARAARADGTLASLPALEAPLLPVLLDSAFTTGGYFEIVLSEVACGAAGGRTGYSAFRQPSFHLADALPATDAAPPAMEAAPVTDESPVWAARYIPVAREAQVVLVRAPSDAAVHVARDLRAGVACLLAVSTGGVASRASITRLLKTLASLANVSGRRRVFRLWHREEALTIEPRVSLPHICTLPSYHTRARRPRTRRSLTTTPTRAARTCLTRA